MGSSWGGKPPWACRAEPDTIKDGVEGRRLTLLKRVDQLSRSFRQTFQAIKPTDAVIVGMYNEFSDEPAENAELVRRNGAPLARPT
jgi:hypothetical protein